MSNTKKARKTYKKIKNAKKTIKYGKYVFGLLSIEFLMIFMVLIMVLAIGGKAEDLNGEDMKIPEEHEKAYEKIQDSIKEVDMPIKYIFGTDFVLKEGSIEDDVVVKKENMSCFYYETKEDDKTKYKLYEEKEKDNVYDCLGWSNNEIKMFEVGLQLYTTYGSDSSDEVVFGGTFIRPTKSGSISNEFGGVDLSFAGGGHTGIDIANELNTPIYPSAPGEILSINYEPEGGNKVIIKHKINGKEFVTYYGHMSKLTTNYKVGDKVDVNDKIGLMGDTGQATGVHLHFEIMVDTQKNDHSKAVNPREYVDFPKLGESFKDRGNIAESHEDIMRLGGVKEEDYKHADFIVFKESSWNHLAVNSSSGAYGLCQALPGEKLATAGEDWKTNPVTQMKWCNTYAHERYGSWAEAEVFWRANEWW